MNKGKRFGAIGGSAIALVLAAGVPAASWAQDAAAGQDGAKSYAIDEIMVTAQRKESSLQDTPVTLSAFGEMQLEVRQMQDVRSIIFNTPNVTGNSNVGQSSALTLFIRGVGTTENSPTVDPTVPLYIDDVYIARQGANNVNFLDVERIEVLRGPQGVLYGRNATAGAVKVITKKPGPDLSGKAEVVVGNYDRNEYRGALNVPVVEDELFLRGSFNIEDGDGYTENLTLGKDVNDLERQDARLAMRWLASDDLEINISADWSRNEQNGLFGVDIAGIVEPVTGDYFKTLGGEDQFNVAETYGITATVDYDISDRVSLTLISSYRKTDQKLSLDASALPQPIYLIRQDTSSEQLSQEAKLSARLTDNLDLTAGLYAFTEDSDVFISDDLAFPGPGPRTPVLVSDRTYKVGADSYAAFTHLAYQITPDVELQLGGRITRDEKKLEANQIINGNQGFTTDSLIALGNDLSPSFTRFTWKAGIQWDVSEDLMLYSSVATGFRSGSWQARVNNANDFVNFPSEKLTTYEAGAKGDLFDGRFRWSLAAFYNDFRDLLSSAPGGNDGFPVLTIDAETYGLEGDFNFSANSWLQFFGNFGLLNADPTNVIPELAPFVGPRLQRSPTFSGKLGFVVDYPLEKGALLLNGDVFYTSKYYTNPQNSPASVTGDYALINAKIGYRFENEKYKVMFGCTNCADKEYFDNILDFASFGFTTVFPGDPRLWEFSMSAEF